MTRRFLLIGLFVVVPARGSMLQIAIALLVAVVHLVIQLIARPYRRLTDNILATAGSFSIVILLVCLILFKQAQLTDLHAVHDVLSTDLWRRFEVPSATITSVALGSVACTLVAAALLLVVQFGAEAAQRVQEQRAAVARRLRHDCDGKEVLVPSIPLGQFHLFLSHVWSTGQDQMRIAKQRLVEMLPSLVVFLDVDDLAEGKGAEFVDASLVTLIFCSEGYFGSPNCMRELLRAVLTGKPIVTVVETDGKHGSITLERIRKQLDAADGHHTHWGLAGEVQQWGYAMPSAYELFAALGVCGPPIEWNRVGAFLDVTMRLIAEALLPEADHGHTYQQGDIQRQPKPLLPPPRNGNRFHLFCSPHNAGAADLAAEVSAAMGVELLTSCDEADLAACERMLVYLHANTWTSGASSDAFATQVEHMMSLGASRLLLAHEAPGLDASDVRGTVRFDAFFASEAEGGTPERLLRRGIYHSIATALKGGDWRIVSMHMMVRSLAKQVAITEVDAALTAEAAASPSAAALELSGRQWWRFPFRVATPDVERSLPSAERPQVELLQVELPPSLLVRSLSNVSSSSRRYEEMVDGAC